MSRSLRERGLFVASSLGLLLLGGCDDPADLARDVTDAQGECNQDSLRTGSEECVQMFQRYAEMATEAMHTYIGGMQALDQALQRMPPANFDTASFGRALRQPADESTAAEDRGGGTNAPAAPSFNRARERGGYAGIPDTRGERSSVGQTWRDPRLEERGTRNAALGGWPEEGGSQRSDPRAWSDPAARTGERSGWDGPRGWGDAEVRGRARGPDAPRDDRARFASEPPPRSAPGRLLPPEERLNRPWIGRGRRASREEEGYREAERGAYLPREEDAEYTEREPPRER